MESERGVKTRRSEGNADGAASRGVKAATPVPEDSSPLFNRTGRRLKGPEDYAATHSDDLEVKVVMQERKTDDSVVETPVRVLFCRFCQSEVTSKSNRISEHLQSVRHNRFKQGIKAGETWSSLAAMYGAHSSSKLAAANNSGNGNGGGSNLHLDTSNGHNSASAPSSSSSSSAHAISNGALKNGIVKKQLVAQPLAAQNDAKQRRMDQFAFDVLQTSAYLGVSSTLVEKEKAVLLNAFAKYVPNCVPRGTKFDIDDAARRWLPEIFVKHVEEVRVRLRSRLISLTIDDRDGRSADYASTNVDIYANVFDAVADEQRVYLLWSVSLPLAQSVAQTAEALNQTVESVLRLFECDPSQVIAVATSCSALTRRLAELFMRKRPTVLHVPNIRNILQRTIYRALTCESELEVVFNLVKQTEQCFRHAVGVRQAYLEACVAAGISPENVVCWNVYGNRWQSWFSAARSVHKSWSFLSAFLDTVGSEQLAAGGCLSGEFSAKQFSELKACFTADEHRELIYLLLTAVIDALEPFREVAQYLDEDVDLPFKVAYLLNTKLKRAAESPLSDRVLCMINVLARTKQERVLRIVNQFRASLASSFEQELERASVGPNVFAAGGFFERCAVFDPMFKTLAQYSAEQSGQLLASFDPYFTLLASISNFVAPIAGHEFCEYVMSHPVQQCGVAPTQFWKSNVRKYPSLSSLTLQLAAIPVGTPFRDYDCNTAASERPQTPIQFLPSAYSTLLAPLLTHCRDASALIVRILHENVAVFVEGQKRSTSSVGTPMVRDATAAAVAAAAAGLLSKLDNAATKLCAANISAALVQLPTQAGRPSTDVLSLSKAEDDQIAAPTPKRRRVRSPLPTCDSPSSTSASNNDYSASDHVELNRNETDEKGAEAEAEAEGENGVQVDVDVDVDPEADSVGDS